MSCQSYESSDETLGRTTRFFLFLFALVAGGFLIASLPEIKRYIKISTM